LFLLSKIFHIGEPLLLDIEIRLASFDSISEVNMDYTLTLYLNQYWRDDRLIFGNKSEEMTLTGEIIDKFWLPDTFFPNDKSAYLHDVTEKNKMIRLNGNGEILYGMRFTSTLACMMDLRRYPLDRQNCTVEVESYGYTQADVIMRWKNGRASILDLDKVQLPQFTITGYDTISYGIYLATGKIKTKEYRIIDFYSKGVYQRLSLSFILQRNIGYFLFQTYLPSILIVMLSWVSFWINHEATSARVALGKRQNL
jgi:gamma-aminobutyric acid receptor subunit beta